MAQIIRDYGDDFVQKFQPLKHHQLKEGILPKNTTKLSLAEITKTNLGFDIEQCPCCKTGKMIIVQQFAANAPPKHINDKRKTKKMN